jgi:hypothetical protein
MGSEGILARKMLHMLYLGNGRDVFGGREIRERLTAMAFKS